MNKLVIIIFLSFEAIESFFYDTLLMGIYHQVLLWLMTYNINFAFEQNNKINHKSQQIRKIDDKVIKRNDQINDYWRDYQGWIRRSRGK